MCYKSMLSQTLQYPPGSQYVYSDLSMMTLANCVGRLAADLGYVTDADTQLGCPVGEQLCYYEAYVRRYVFEAMGMPSSRFFVDEDQRSSCAPTLNDTSYRHTVVQGLVEDSNAYAMGGVSGHAGVFAPLRDIVAFARRWLFAATDDPLLNATTAALFVKEQNHAQSSRALGWNTNDYTAPDQGWNQCCGTLSESTFMHIGYTGTMICVDPARNLIVVLLTNHVYPTADNADEMHQARQNFATAVQQIYDGQRSRQQE
eukprot:TRINITY_DN3251_c0_g1_i1.p1 TRINITY_DN3251_c0_g1~~TRINITY_DN3251_c0_g1_i1.p1  ORF type:complete len:258 (-),score=58.73 TRINITY_DN3251_c0_g1_i1:20-793(-)